MRRLVYLLTFMAFTAFLYSSPSLYQRLGDLPESTIVYRINQISPPLFVDIRSVSEKLSYRIRRSPEWFTKISMRDVLNGQLTTPKGTIYYNDPYFSKSSSELFKAKNGIYIETEHLSLKAKAKLIENVNLVKVSFAPISKEQEKEANQIFSDIMNEFVGNNKLIKKYGTAKIVEAVSKYHKVISEAKEELVKAIKMNSSIEKVDEFIFEIENSKSSYEQDKTHSKKLSKAIANYLEFYQKSYQALNYLIDSEINYLVKKDRLGLANKIAEISLTFQISKSV